jgi:tetratricopeptide (TPR) repeat protein
LLLAAVLFGGIGALLYVALGERAQRTPIGKLEGTQPPDEVGSGKPETPALKPDSGSAAVAGSNAPAGSGSDNPGLKLEDKQPPDKPGATVKPPVQRPKPPVRVAVNEKDPQALLSKGDAFARQQNWEAARQMYEKLESLKGYAGIAQYQQAWVAFRSNDNQRAEDLAKKAIANTQGAWQFRAKTLYGDAMFGKGLYQRAKDVYINLRNGSQNAKMKADLATKIKNCNKGLNAPVNDGL